ncbi:conserved hypothetical protein, partial [Ricinus communis]
VVALTLIRRNDRSVVFPLNAITSFSEKYPITTTHLKTEDVAIDRKDRNLVAMLLIHLSGKRLHTRILGSLLDSDTFLEYDLSLGAFRELPVYQGMSQLHEEIRSFARSQEGLNFSQTAIYLSRNTTIRIADLIAIQNLLDRAANIFLLATAVIQYLKGSAFEMPLLRPSTPITDQVEALDEERVTADEAARYVGL